MRRMEIEAPHTFELEINKKNHKKIHRKSKAIKMNKSLTD